MTESMAACCETYHCEDCGKESPRLSESWSTLRISQNLCDLLDLPAGTHTHRCLECRSQR